MNYTANFTKYNIKTLQQMAWIKKKTGYDEDGDIFTIYEAAMKPGLFKTVFSNGYTQYAWNF
jgi:hypothetical protein